MRNPVTGLILAGVAVLAFSPGIESQTAPQSGAARTVPDLSGIWHEDRVPDGVPPGLFTKEEPPMQPWAVERSRVRNRRTRPEVDDPSMYPYCMPRTFPRVYNFEPIIEILQTPDRVHMLFEPDHHVRRIFLDGRKHLEGWGRTWLGTSYGRWDADTLIVETDNIISLDGHAWFDREGHPFTDALRVTERIRRPTRETLRIDFLFDDPGTFTRPWTAGKTLQLRPDMEMIESDYCQTHNMQDFLRDIESGKPAGQP